MLKIASAKCIYCMQSLVRLALSVVYGFATRLQRPCQTPSFPPSSHPRLSSVRALIGICPWAVHHSRHHNKHTCSFPWHHPNAFLSAVPARTHAGMFHTRRTAIAVFSCCDFHLPRFIWLGVFIQRTFDVSYFVLLHMRVGSKNKAILINGGFASLRVCALENLDLIFAFVH